MSKEMTLTKILERHEDFADRYVINRLHNDIGELLQIVDSVKENLEIADGYLCSLALSHPHLVPNEKTADGYRLTIYDKEPEK